MITAVDTNILLDILRPNPGLVDSSAEALLESSGQGSLVICDIVYAELCVHFNTQQECDSFLADAEIRVEPIGVEAGFLASRAWRAYRVQGGKRERILPDFLIGAHAQVQASRLLTRDRGFFRSAFPSLVRFEPRHPASPAG